MKAAPSFISNHSLFFILPSVFIMKTATGFSVNLCWFSFRASAYFIK